MSECVVKMEMPKGCFCCPIQGFNSHEVSVCGIGRKSVDRIIGKPDWCPIICQLPEGHGDLVDSEEDISNYITIWDCNCSEFGRQTVMAVDDLQYLPVIVPAERGETWAN